jgi:hypothetical protein
MIDLDLLRQTVGWSIRSHRRELDACLHSLLQAAAYQPGTTEELN